MFRSAMMLAAALVGGLVIAFLASLPPRALPAGEPPAVFSAGRAMADIRSIARAPHPTGSAENARVRAYLTGRMRQLGMAVASQEGPLPAKSAERLVKWGDRAAAARSLTNIVGFLQGRDPSKPALLVMAHHDSVWGSPGASDDSAGVAAALELIRAVKVRGVPERNVVVLFTDGEELGLDGARLFFDLHPLARRIGAVINMEARGGGGRTSMFETGPGNEHWVEVYRRSVSRPFSNSLGVLVYQLMPNNTDFTIPKKLGLPGFNFAFIGKPALYHSPMATPDALDQRSLQDMGDQALGTGAALAFAPNLPATGGDAVFGDVLGLFVIAYSPVSGWMILLVSAGLFGFAYWQLRKEDRLGWKGVAGGAAIAVSLLLHGALLLRVANLVSGSGGPTNYYDRLAAIPRLELMAFLLCLATLLIASIAARPVSRLSAAAPALLLMFIGILLAGWSPVLLGLGIASAVAAMLLPRRGPGTWTGWFGLAFLLLLIAFAVQVAAPTAAPVLQWPLVLAGAGAAFASWRDPALERSGTSILLVLLAALGVGQILYLAHFTFLGVGAGLPEAMAAYALLAAMLLWPLLGQIPAPRAKGLAALMLVLVATATALSVRLDSPAGTIPLYSEAR